MKTVALVTCALHPRLYAEEGELPRLIAERGIKASVLNWDDPKADWASFDAVVLRSTWDYFERFAEFRGWLDRIEALKVRLWNPVPLVRWNWDKRYLRELEQRGVRIVPTAFCEPGQPADLAELLKSRGWARAVLKPAISGGAYRTHRLDAAEAAQLQPELDSILTGCGALVQPFFPEILSEGEFSLFYFGGEYSHAVLKVPAANEYRIQPQFGGRAIPVNPEAWMKEQAKAVLDALPIAPAYARIDGLRRGKELFLMEAELIEPYFFLGAVPEATGRVLDLVERLVKSS